MPGSGDRPRHHDNPIISRALGISQQNPPANGPIRGARFSCLLLSNGNPFPEYGSEMSPIRSTHLYIETPDPWLWRLFHAVFTL
ncbi:unnamed protein product [Gadus morhua 'NCC']